MVTYSDKVKLLGVTLVVLLVASACSGAPRPGAPREAARTVADAPPSTESGDIAPEGAAEAQPDVPGSPSARGGGRVSTTIAAPGQRPTVTTDASGAPIANLFKPEEDKVGISEAEVRICMHAAFLLGDVFNNKKQDEDVYWRKLNDEGGIYGRKVRIQFEDDKYNANEAIASANACKDQRNFMMFGGVGFDQVPAVRDWAETNRQLYFYSMATEDGAQGKQFSFAAAPTLQMVGRQIAQYLLKAHPGKKYAVISRRSPNWDGALDSFKAELAKRGSPVVTEHKVDNGQGSYVTVINDLKNKCPAAECVVFANENVLNFVQIYNQAKEQPHNYRPRWFNYGFQLTNDTLGAETADDPALQAWYPTPAFDLSNSTNQPWWGEVQAMRAAYQKYCNGDNCKRAEELNDVDWQFWLAFKAMHKMLLDCGKDCTRNRLVGMLLSGYKTKVDPLCEADYSRGNNHFGAHAANIYESVRAGNASVFKQVETCKESF